MMIANGASNADKATLVREHSEKFVRKEMEKVTPDIPYTLLELIGRGSFGCVYKAVHNETKQLCAVKSLDLDQTDEEIDDIRKEIGILSQLKAADAPNITAYHGSFLLGARLWVIMDFCSGGSMRTLMKAGPIEERFIVVVIRETLLALGFLHKNGIIHRDVKAANILVSQEGKVQLCDFGVSAQLVNKNGKRNTFVGTPQWMAPETMTGGQYDARIDIWSFGITIIEMAKQKPPLHHIDPRKVVDMIPRLPPPRLEGGTWSNALREFVALCLNEVPDERATVEELQRSKLMKAAKAPTSIMRELIMRHELWEKGGGVRGSILVGGPMDQGHRDSMASDPGWDFDTIKSRASGVPKEWDMITSPSTIRAPQHPGPQRRTPMRPGRPRGAAEGLFRLFENPDTPQLNWNDAQSIGSDSDYRSNSMEYRAITPDSSNNSMNIISIPSFNDDGVQISNNNNSFNSFSTSSNNNSFSTSSNNNSFSISSNNNNNNSFHSNNSNRTPSPIGQIVMPSFPTDEEIIAMAQQKAAVSATTVPPQPQPAPVVPPVVSPASIPPTPASLPVPHPPPPPLAPVNVPPPSRTQMRSDSSGTSAALRPLDIPPPSPGNLAQRDPSPRRPFIPPTSSAPSSPPRHKPHHLPSKSVPNFAARRQDGDPTPPVPSIRKAGHSRSQDVTIRRPVGRKPAPRDLNLGNSNWNRGPEWPALEPLHSEVLLPTGNGLEIARELDRVLGGLGDALEVVEVALKRLRKEGDVKLEE